MKTRRPTRPFLLARTAGMWLLAIVVTSTAFGQGTSGMVPDPITTRELDRGLTRLELSPQQLQAVNALHDNYGIEYAELRRNEIEKFVEEANGLRRGMRWATDRKAVESSMRDYERLLGRIKRLDNRLFDEIETLVTEEQVPYLTRARQARERKRYRSGMTRWVGARNAAAQVDVSSVVLDLQLPPDQLAEIDPILAQYERTLTSHVKKLNELLTGLPLESMKRLDAMGFTQEAMEDPRQRGAMFEAMREIWNELYEDINKRTTSISDLNKRTCKNMVVVLPEESARKLRDEYNVRAYPDIPSTPPVAERGIAAALRLDQLTDEQRAEILALRDQLRRDLDRITDQAIKTIDEARSRQRGFGFGGGSTESQRGLEELRERRRVVQNQAVRTLEGLLGADLADRVRARVAAGDNGEGDDGGGGGGGGVIGTEVAQNLEPGLEPGDVGSDPFLPGPITGRVLRRYAERIQLDEEMLPLLEGVHEDYVAKYEELSHTTLAPLRTARWRLRGTDEEPATVKDVQELFAKRRRALKDILALDQAFFDEVALVLEDDQAARLERVKLARQRMIFNRGLESQSASAVVFGGDRGRRGRGRSWWFGDDASREASVDVARITEELALSEAEVTASDPVLEEYERAAVTAFRQAYDANLRLQEVVWSLRVRGDEAERAGENRWRRIGGEYRQMQDTVARNASDAQALVVELNRGTMERLTEVLSSAVAADLQREYRRLAYDRIYRDPRSANELLSVTLEMDDLTTDQRMEVTEIAGDYRHAYDALCDRMVLVQSEAIDAEGSNWSERQERWQRLERLRFDRDELSDKARLRIRAVLAEHQLQRLGGLVDPPSEDLES